MSLKTNQVDVQQITQLKQSPERVCACCSDCGQYLCLRFDDQIAVLYCPLGAARQKQKPGFLVNTLPINGNLVTAQTFCGIDLLLGINQGEIANCKLQISGRRLQVDLVRNIYQLKPAAPVRGLDCVLFSLPKALQTETEQSYVTLLIGTDKAAYLLAGPGRNTVDFIQSTIPFTHELPGACEMEESINNVQIRSDADGMPIGWAWMAAQRMHRKKYGPRQEEVDIEESEGWETIEEKVILDDRGEELSDEIEFLTQIRTSKLPNNPRGMLAAVCGLPSTDIDHPISISQRANGLQAYSQTLETWFMQAQTATSPLLSRPSIPFSFVAGDREILLMFQNELASISLSTKNVVWMDTWQGVLQRAFKSKQIDYVREDQELRSLDSASIFTESSCFRIELVQQPAYLDYFWKQQYQEALEIAEPDEKDAVRKQYGYAQLERNQTLEAAAVLAKTNIQQEVVLGDIWNDKEARFVFASQRLSQTSLTQAAQRANEAACLRDTGRPFAQESIDRYEALRQLLSVGVVSGVSLLLDLKSQAAQDGNGNIRGIALGKRVNEVQERVSNLVKKYRPHVLDDVLALVGTASENSDLGKRVGKLLLKAQKTSSSDAKMDLFEVLELEVTKDTQTLLFGNLVALHALDPVRCTEVVAKFCRDNFYSETMLLFNVHQLQQEDAWKVLAAVRAKKDSKELAEAALRLAIQTKQQASVAELLNQYENHLAPWIEREVFQQNLVDNFIDLDRVNPVRCATLALHVGNEEKAAEMIQYAAAQEQKVQIARMLAEWMLQHGRPISEIFQRTQDLVPLLDLLDLKPDFELSGDLKKIVKDTLDAFQDRMDHMSKQLDAAKHSTDLHRVEVQRFDRRFVRLQRNSLCSECAAPLKDAFTVFACGHKFCTNCLKQHYEEHVHQPSLKQKYQGLVKAGGQKLADFLSRECILCQADEFLDPLE